MNPDCPICYWGLVIVALVSFGVGFYVGSGFGLI